MINPDLQQRFRDLLRRCDDAHLEYEEKHGDAGDAYCHCVIESLGSLEKLDNYIQTNFPEWTDRERQAVIDEFDRWSFDMVPGHRFSTWPTTEPDEQRKGCCVWGAAIEEVENQYEVKVLADELDCEVEDIRELVLAEKECREFCIGSIHRPESFDTFDTYQSTDVCWFAVVPYDWFIDTIYEVRAREE